MIFMVVLLPAPLGPRKPRISPRATLNDTASSAAMVPKLFETPRTSIIAKTPSGLGSDRRSKYGTTGS